TLPEDVDLFLSGPVASVNILELYQRRAADSSMMLISRTGDRLPFAERPWPVWEFLLPVRLEARQQSTYLLKVDKRGQHFLIKTRLGKREVILQEDIPIYTTFSFYAGIFAFALLFNILMFLSVSDRIYLYYSLYIVCSVTLVLDEVGLTKEWLFQDLGR